MDDQNPQTPTDQPEAEQPQADKTTRTLAEVIEMIQTLDKKQVSTLKMLIHRAQEMQDDGLPQDEIIRQLTAMAEQVKNPPVALDRLSYDELDVLVWQVLDKRQEVSNKAFQIAKADLAERVAKLRAELESLTGEDTVANAQAASVLSQMDYRPEQANPHYDPAPELEYFGSTRLEAYDKHYLREAFFVVGCMVQEDILPIMPSSDRPSDDTSQSLMAAVIMISRTMWITRHNHNFADALDPESTVFDDYDAPDTDDTDGDDESEDE